MCSVEEDIEELASTSNQRLNCINTNIDVCKKCKKKSVLLLQKKDPFCQQCFYEYCDHKFRSTIGKNKKIKHGERVVLACSGGRKSAALLHMTKKALDSASVKQISIIPCILFIDESVVTPDGFAEKSQVLKILDELKSFGYPVYVSSVEMVYNVMDEQDFYWPVEKCVSDPQQQNKLKECISVMSLSAKLDFIKKLRLLLLTEIALKLDCNYVFVGDSASSLAISLLTDINLGRGSQISADTNFYDSRFKVPVCRPLREFLDKELALYNHLYKCNYFVLPDLSTMTDATSSVQRLSEAFITNLQKDFPATIFTIFRTGGKLSKSDAIKQGDTCILCKSKLDNLQPDKCSALEALRISEQLSENLSAERLQKINENDIQSSESEHVKNLNVLNLLCHGCSIPFRTKKEVKYFPILHPEQYVLQNRSQMKEEIKEFLLNDDET